LPEKVELQIGCIGRAEVKMQSHFVAPRVALDFVAADIGNRTAHHIIFGQIEKIAQATTLIPQPRRLTLEGISTSVGQALARRSKHDVPQKTAVNSTTTTTTTAELRTKCVRSRTTRRKSEQLLSNRC
jgi:hypothetical protein